MRRLLVSFTALTLLVQVALLPASSPAAAVQKDNEVGLKVGDKIPPIKLKNADGKVQTFKDLSKKRKYVAFVFYRSAAW